MKSESPPLKTIEGARSKRERFSDAEPPNEALANKLHALDELVRLTAARQPDPEEVKDTSLLVERRDRPLSIKYATPSAPENLGEMELFAEKGPVNLSLLQEQISAATTVAKLVSPKPSEEPRASSKTSSSQNQRGSLKSNNSKSSTTSTSSFSRSAKKNSKNSSPPESSSAAKASGGLRSALKQWRESQLEWKRLSGGNPTIVLPVKFHAEAEKTNFSETPKLIEKVNHVYGYEGLSRRDCARSDQDLALARRNGSLTLSEVRQLKASQRREQSAERVSANGKGKNNTASEGKAGFFPW